MASEMTKQQEELMLAVKAGDATHVFALLDEGTSTNCKDENGNSPMHLAAKGGYLHIVEGLLHHGAEVDSLTKYGYTPLHGASMKGDLPIVKMLLASGASFNAATKSGETALFWAASNGHIDVAKALIAHGATVDNQNNTGDTALKVAAQKGHVEIVQELLARGANVGSANRYGETPLHWAAWYGFLPVVKELLANNASVDTTNQIGNTPLQWAANCGHLDVVRELVANNASVDAANEMGFTALHWASENGHLEIVKLLLDHGAQVDLPEKNGNTPLHKASESGQIKVIQELVAFGADIDQANSNGATPLDEAAFNGHLNVVEELLRHNAKLENEHLVKSTALHRAVESGKIDIIKALLDHGASMDVKTLDGSSPLHIAAQLGYLEVVKELLKRDASIEAADNNCNSPLHRSASFGHVDVVKELLGQGAVVDATSMNGDTPLHLASDNGHLDVAQELLSRKATFNLGNEDDETALHKASQKGHVTIVKALLEAGANVNFLTKIGNTARSLGSPEIQKLIDLHQIDQVEMKIHTIQSAVETIQQVLSDSDETASELFATARAIFTSALQFKVQRTRVLTTSLMIERIVRHIQQYGAPRQVRLLLLVLKEIDNYLKTSLQTSQNWKLQLDDVKKQAKIQVVSNEIIRLQDRLTLETKGLYINLNVQVVGHMDDLRGHIGHTMDKVSTFKDHLKALSTVQELRQRSDGLVEMAIQIKRGLEFYRNQVNVGNSQRFREFEEQVKLCEGQMEEVFNNFAKLRKMPKGWNSVEKWMISSDDIYYDPAGKPLGQGAFGTVFKGTYHGDEVAIKRFDGLQINDPIDLERTIGKEIKAWKDISSEPYILTLHGVCTKCVKPILVSELCQSNIRRYVRDWPGSLIPMVYQLACGLVSLHNANIIHRDLKGDNILVTYRKTVAIADFGLSRTVTSLENTKTSHVKTAGTLNWMSPEQLFTPRRVTTKSDVWSFGMTLWEILCNDTPFRGASENEFVNGILKSNDDRPAKPTDLQSELEPLWTLITKCWQLDPNDRLSADAIVDYLKEHYTSEVAKL